MEPLFGRDYTSSRTKRWRSEEYNNLGEEVAQAQRDLIDWDEWYQQGFPPQTLVFLTLQTYLPAQVDGLSAIEVPVRAAGAFSEALSFLRSWRPQQILSVVHDLKGNPEPLQLLNSLKTLTSSLIAGDTALAMEVSQMDGQTNMKTFCTDATFIAMLDLLEIQLSSSAHEEDEEEKRHQKSANVAIAASAAAGKGSGKSKPSTKPTCRDYLTKNGCTRGGQCSFLHPPTVGRGLRRGSANMPLLNAHGQYRRRPHFHPRAKVNITSRQR